MFTEGKPEGKGEEPQDTQEFKCALKCCGFQKDCSSFNVTFLVFSLLFHSQVVCSLCKCSPPSLPALQRVPHTPDGTTGYSCRHTGPSSPETTQTRMDLASTVSTREIKKNVCFGHYLIPLWLSAPWCSTE